MHLNGAVRIVDALGEVCRLVAAPDAKYVDFRPEHEMLMRRVSAKDKIPDGLVRAALVSGIAVGVATASLGGIGLGKKKQDVEPKTGGDS